MSLLPQRKKSAEEIAQLRENLGIPVVSPEAAAEPAVIEKIIPNTHQAVLEHPVQAARIELPPEESPHQVVHSLKRSERTPTPAVAEPAPAPELPAKSPKQVRSLRKSEQGPLPSGRISEEARVPYQRHSEQEMKELHRREALALLSPSAAPIIRTLAHPALLVPGYLATIIAAAGFHFYEFQIAVTAGCLAVSLCIATFVYIRNPYSRHHAAFIAIAVLFTAVFAALHYFPQLNFQNGS